MYNDPSNLVVFFSFQALKCKKCIEIAPNFVLFNIQIVNVPNFYVTMYNDPSNFVVFFSFQALKCKKCIESAPIIVHFTYRLGTFPNFM